MNDESVFFSDKALSLALVLLVIGIVVSAVLG